MKRKPRKNPVQEAIQVFGSQSALAKLMGVRQVTIYRWAKSGVVSSKKLLLFEKITGIPRHKVSPKLYEQYERKA